MYANNGKVSSTSSLAFGKGRPTAALEPSEPGTHQSRQTKHEKRRSAGPLRVSDAVYLINQFHHRLHAMPAMSSVPWPRAGVQCRAHVVPVLFGHDRCCEESQFAQAAGASHAKHCETGIDHGFCLIGRFKSFVFPLL